MDAFFVIRVLCYFGDLQRDPILYESEIARTAIIAVIAPVFLFKYWLLGLQCLWVCVFGFGALGSFAYFQGAVLGFAGSGTEVWVLGFIQA